MKPNKSRIIVWDTLVYINGKSFSGQFSASTAETAARRACAAARKDPANYHKRFDALAVAVTKQPKLPGALEAFTQNTVGKAVGQAVGQ